MRKFFCLILVLAISFSLFSTSAYAVEEAESVDVITFEDGSYLTITVEEYSTRATNTKNGYKRYTFYDGSNNMEWQAILNASFTYNGTSSYCTSASCTVNIYENAWYEYSKSTTRSGNTATTELTMGQKFLGITIAKHNYTITLTCDKDGKLS